MRRTEVRAAYSGPRGSVSAKYAFIDAQPLYGFPSDREEVSGGASAKVTENWSVFASGTYDIQQEALIARGAGFSYADECFTYLMTFSQSFNKVTDERSTSVGFNISFRTLGDIGSAI